MSGTQIRVRYIVTDIDAALAFYTKALGFRIQAHPGPEFALLSRGPLQLLLNRPGAGGAGQATPDGRQPAPGGWNRIQLEVNDLGHEVERLMLLSVPFRNTVVNGNGGQQLLIEDPAGNPIELFQPHA